MFLMETRADCGADERPITKQLDQLIRGPYGFGGSADMGRRKLEGQKCKSK